MGMAPYIMSAMGIIAWIFHIKKGQDFRPTLLEVLNISRSIS